MKHRLSWLWLPTRGLWVGGIKPHGLISSTKLRFLWRRRCVLCGRSESFVLWFPLQSLGSAHKGDNLMFLRTAGFPRSTQKESHHGRKGLHGKPLFTSLNYGCPNSHKRLKHLPPTNLPNPEHKKRSGFKFLLRQIHNPFCLSLTSWERTWRDYFNR